MVTTALLAQQDLPVPTVTTEPQDLLAQLDQTESTELLVRPEPQGQMVMTAQRVLQVQTE